MLPQKKKLCLLDQIKDRNQDFLDVVNDMNRQKTFKPWINPIDPLEEELAEMHTRVEIMRLGHPAPSYRELNEDPMYRKIFQRNQMCLLEKPFRAMKVESPEFYCWQTPPDKWGTECFPEGFHPRDRLPIKTPIAEVPPICNLFGVTRAVGISPIPQPLEDDIQWISKEEYDDLQARGELDDSFEVFGPDGPGLRPHKKDTEKEEVDLGLPIPFFLDLEDDNQTDIMDDMMPECLELEEEPEEEAPPDGAAGDDVESPPPELAEEAPEPPKPEKRVSIQADPKSTPPVAQAPDVERQSRKGSSDVDKPKSGQLSRGESMAEGKSVKSGQPSEKAEAEEGGQEKSAKSELGSRKGSTSQGQQSAKEGSRKGSTSVKGEEEAEGEEGAQEKSAKSGTGSRKGSKSEGLSAKEGSQRSASKHSASAASKSPEKTEDEEETTTKSERTETPETPATEGDEEGTETGEEATPVADE